MSTIQVSRLRAEPFLFFLLVSSTLFHSAIGWGQVRVENNSTAWKDPITGMEFVLIKGDCYLMGSPGGENDRYEDETQHKVCVGDFWLGKYEVTNKQFSLFVEDRGYVTTSEKSKEGFGISRAGADDWGWQKGIDWKHPLWPKDEIENKMNHPVTQISWYDAKEFLNWLTEKHNGANTFRLPYEAEWEYACRAGTTTARYWGDQPDDACEYASVADERAGKTWPSLATHNCSDGYETTSPVGRFRPNHWGIHDILGNVWELTENVYADYGEDLAESLAQVDPNPLQVMRGGSWIYGPAHVRCAFRNIISRSGRSYSIGFRAVRTPSTLN